jgi:thioredoxin reductase
MADAVDVAIIGGGPAGQAAALQLAALPCSITVLDEQPAPGGQILRQPAVGLPVGEGGDYPELRAQLQRFRDLDPDWRGGRSVLGIERTGDGFRLIVAGPEGIERLAARKVLVAAGCQDLAVPLPGWTLPGVMAAGGLQAFLKGQKLVPGRRIALAGTHPLMLLIAEQIVAAGGEVAAVAFAQPIGDMLRSGLSNAAAGLRGGSNLAMAGAAVARLHKAGVPVLTGARLLEIDGDDCVRAVQIEGRGSRACDAVGLCFGFVPQADLVRAAGVHMRPAGAAGGWAAVVDPWMQTSLTGLYAAGETTGVAGAPAAATGGALAGLAIAQGLGLASAREAARRAAALRRRHRRQLDFAQLLDRFADPSRWWPDVRPETLACRCENVPFEALERALDQVRTADAAKLMTRCGMGLCQGRNCEPTLLRLLEARGCRADPGFAARFPARPVPIGDLAMLEGEKDGRDA